MSWEGVPWFVDGGEHGPEVARVLAYCAMGGFEGVVGVDDCKVAASAIPDGNVHIAPGAIAALNQFPGGDSQGYILRNVGDEVKALAAQGSSGVRYDLVAAIVQDPQYVGQPAPVSVPNGPYVVTAVYQDVGPNVTTLAEVDADQTGLALALVKFDASDGTVTTSDITDLRRTLYARSKTVTRMASVTAGVVAMSTGGVAVFPTTATWTVEVPAWANKVQLSAVVSGVSALDDGVDGGTATGVVQVELDTIVTDTANWKANATGPGKETTVTLQAAEDNLDVPIGIRGKKVTLRVQAVKSGGAGMTMRQSDGTTAVVTATFMEATV